MLRQPRWARDSALLLSIAALGLAAPLACGGDDDDAQAAPPGPGEDASTPPDDGAPSETTTDAPATIFTERPYAVTTPSKYDAKVATPLVVLLHGYSGNASFQDSYFRLSALAQTKTFLVALPEGTKDALKNQFWNASDACCDFAQTGVDDVAYLKALIADMKSRFNVDAKRVYVVGHSNGGFMAHRMACELSAEIAGIVSLAGAAYADPAKCAASQPVAVLQVHGDADETVSYAGGTLVAGAGAYPSAKATVATWAEKNGCDAALTATGDTLDLDTGLAGAETTIERHACTAGAAELWTIAGGAHIPSFGAAWAERLYGFLEAHPKP
ncbi:MAG: alpha/beta hydrolase fold domain-containing protein [Labilithrix sp.]|nr:alpha/beta hydrolase fold domain-containing protein [Labilithrix sp.]